MGYRLKYHNLKVVRYTNLKGKKVYGVAGGNILVSTIGGLTKIEAKKQLKYYQKIKEYKFP